MNLNNRSKFRLKVNIYNNLDNVPPIPNAVLALGSFDGMHLAHRHLVERVCTAARQIHGNSVILSFFLHPRKTISKDFNQGVLTTQEEKIDILNKMGLRNLIFMDFTTDIANMNYIDFIVSLRKKMNIKKIILGYNHHFGKNREGCGATLLSLGKELDFEVEEIEKQTIDGINISSSSIRDMLSSGNIQTANKLLGYHYHLSVQTNDGKEMVLSDKDKILPANGCYSVLIDGLKSCLSIQSQNLDIDSVNNLKNGIYKIEFVS